MGMLIFFCVILSLVGLVFYYWKTTASFPKRMR